MMEEQAPTTWLYTRKNGVVTDKPMGEADPEINDIRIAWCQQSKAGKKI